MGSFILESIRMKVLIAGLLCATVALALPEGRRLRAEEHWRPAQGRDLSKYQPRQAMVPATAENLAWAIKEVKKTGASTKNCWRTRSSGARVALAGGSLHRRCLVLR